MNICITSTSLTAIPETFVQAHLDNLPGNIYFLYGDNLPRKSKEFGELNYYPKNFEKYKRKISKIFSKSKYSTLEEGIIRFLKKNQIDVVFSEFGTTGAEMTPICEILDIPLVVIFHGGDISIYNILETFKRKYEKMVSYASKLIIVSKHMKKNLIELGASEEQIVFSPYGPQPIFRSLDVDYSSNRFVFVGRFTDKKAPYLTLAAFKEFQKKHSNYELVMIGSGNLLNATKNLAKYWNIEEKVIFPGSLQQENFFSYLSKSFCYLQHSIVADNGDSEGTPNSIMEASLAGLPVISTIHAGIPDIVLNNKTGYLINEHDVVAMTERMVYLAENRDVAEKLGQNGRKLMETEFPLEKHINTIFQTLKSAKR